jgi:ferredoxin-NADP reductase
MTDLPPRTSGWQTATVVGLGTETARARSIRLALEHPLDHLAGQHVVVRLTAPDGYTASRSYSIASAPDATGEIELIVERLDEGEVSTFLHDVLEVGDTVEVRGPIGGWFVWRGDAPALLVGGGSGLVPLVAMWRLAAAAGAADRLRLLASVRRADDLIGRADLLDADGRARPGAAIAYTREAPPGSIRPAGRLTADDLRPLRRADDTVFVCGSAGFADHVTHLLAELAVPLDRIRVERFGPSA